MPLIQVTAIIDTDDLPPDEVDLEDPTGLSAAAYQMYVTNHGYAPLQDVDFQLLQDSE